MQGHGPFGVRKTLYFKVPGQAQPAGAGLWGETMSPTSSRRISGSRRTSNWYFMAGGQGQQFAPALRQPTAVVHRPGLGPGLWVHVRALQALQGVLHLPGQVAQVFGYGQCRLGRQGADLGLPQAIAALLRAHHLESVQCPAHDVQQASARPLHLLQPHAGADRLELFGRATGPVHLTATGEGDDTERCALALAFADHLQVAQFKNLQRQQTARKHRRAQGEQGQSVGAGHVGRSAHAGIIARARRSP